MAGEPSKFIDAHPHLLTLAGAPYSVEGQRSQIRLARVSIARNGDESPHCGCDTDSECKGFCSKSQTCTDASWTGIVEACEGYAKDAKAAFTTYKKTQGGASTCVAIMHGNCDAIRALDFSAGYATDSDERTISSKDLRAYYDLPRKDIDAWRTLGYANPGPGAPASCDQVILFGLGKDDFTRSADLFLDVK